MRSFDELAGKARDPKALTFARKSAIDELAKRGDARVVGVLEDLRCEPDQRASPLDAFRRDLSGDLVEALDHSFLVAGLEAGIEQIADGSHHRVVAVVEPAEGCL